MASHASLRQHGASLNEVCTVKYDEEVMSLAVECGVGRFGAAAMPDAPHGDETRVNKCIY